MPEHDLQMAIGQLRNIPMGMHSGSVDPAARVTALALSSVVMDMNHHHVQNLAVLDNMFAAINQIRITLETLATSQEELASAMRDWMAHEAKEEVKEGRDLTEEEAREILEKMNAMYRQTIDISASRVDPAQQRADMFEIIAKIEGK